MEDLTTDAITVILEYILDIRSFARTCRRIRAVCDTTDDAKFWSGKTLTEQARAAITPKLCNVFYLLVQYTQRLGAIAAAQAVNLPLFKMFSTIYVTTFEPIIIAGDTEFIKYLCELGIGSDYYHDDLVVAENNHTIARLLLESFGVEAEHVRNIIERTNTPEYWKLLLQFVSDKDIEFILHDALNNAYIKTAKVTISSGRIPRNKCFDMCSLYPALDLLPFIDTIQ